MSHMQPTTGREYLRVSRDRSGRARSVEEQHNDHVADAREHGWTLGIPYSDPDVSASRFAKKARGDFRQLVEDLETGVFGVEVLLMWEGSRGSRRVGEWVELVELCEARGVRIWVSSKERLYDPAKPHDRRDLLVDAVGSEYEVALTRQRVLRATRATATAGRPHGRLLYGYAREYDERGRYLRSVERPEQAVVVREAARRVAAGEAPWAIARDLTARGIPAPRGGSWDLTQVKRLVTNPAYAAYRVYRGEVIGRADWPAILSESLWVECTTRLTDPRRKTVRDIKMKHLLTGTAVCATCGGPLRVQKNRTHFAYLCATNFCVSVKTTWLEDFVEEMLLTRLERKDALDVLIPPEETEAAAAAAQEADQLQQRLDGFYRQAAAGKLSPEGIASIETDLLPQIEEARRRAQPPPPVPAPLRELPGPGVRQRWADLALPLRRELVGLVLEIRVSPTRRGARRFDPWRLAESRWTGSTETWGDAWRREEL